MNISILPYSGPRFGQIHVLSKRIVDIREEEFQQWRQTKETDPESGLSINEHFIAKTTNEMAKFIAKRWSIFPLKDGKELLVTDTKTKDCHRLHSQFWEPAKEEAGGDRCSRVRFSELPQEVAEAFLQEAHRQQRTIQYHK